jgi:TRAP-type C4-dicarboxylate transport system substrate-binding protein
VRVTRTTIAAALLLAAANGAPRPAGAAEVLKIATLAPQGSLWDTTLREMGARWTRETAGRVELRIYPGGVAGDESDVVRKMRIGQFQGGALSVVGLTELDPAFRVFQIPMFFESWDEVGRVLDRIRPQLESRLRQQGYELLLWGNGGWVHLFSREPIRSVDDLKKQKLFVWAGDDAQVQRWSRNGFHPVALSATEVTMGFQTGMIDVVPTTPIAALTMQWFRQTKYMQGLGLAPLIGGVVVRSSAWKQISEADRGLLLAAAADAEKKLDREVPRQDEEAVEQMKARGLEVIEVSAADRATWRQAAEEFAVEARESQVPPDILQAARDVLAEARRGREGGP